MPTPSDLAAALMRGETVTCPVPFFSDHQAVLELEDIVEFTEANVAETVAAFLSLTDADRLLATRHVHAYFRDIWEEFGEEALSPGKVPPDTPEDVWRLVTPGDLILTNDPHHEPGRFYVVMEAECDWEPEHGLMLCWRDGRTLTKVSPYDGHVTQRNAFADPSLDAVVYHSYRGNTTRA